MKRMALIGKKRFFYAFTIVSFLFLEAQYAGDIQKDALFKQNPGTNSTLIPAVYIPVLQQKRNYLVPASYSINSQFKPFGQKLLKSHLCQWKHQAHSGLQSTLENKNSVNTNKKFLSSAQIQGLFRNSIIPGVLEEL